MDQANTSSRREKYLLLLVPVLIMLSLLWPGDVFWAGGDCAQNIIINNAFKANLAHTLARQGLEGSAGITYHPFPVWIYQFFLSLTDNLIVITFLKSLISVSICAGGLYYLLKSLRYSSFLIIIFFFSPFLYTYHRELTDDSWLVPVSLLLYVCYAWFDKKKSFNPFCCMILCAIVAFHLHLRGAIAILPFFSIFIFHYQWFKKKWRTTLLILGCGLAICLPYLVEIIQQIQSLSPTKTSLEATTGNPLTNFLSTIIRGGEFFPLPMGCLHIVSYLLVLPGILITIIKLAQKVNSSRVIDLEDKIGIIALLTLFLYPVVLLILHQCHSTEYYQGIWFPYLFLIWRTFTTIRNKKNLKYLFSVYTLCMGGGWLCFILLTHSGFINGGFTLENMIETAETISRYSPESKVVSLVSTADQVEKMVGYLNRLEAGAPGFLKRAGRQKLNTLLAFYRDSQTNHLQRALVPLLNIYYRKKDVSSLPIQTLVITYNDKKNKDRVTVITSPEQVRRVLSEQRRHF